MLIELEVVEEDDLLSKIDEWTESYLKFEVGISGFLEEFLSDFKNGCYYLLEYPYVDKVYRDSYYNYYSSKLGKYERNSIKVSIFENEITLDDFYEKESIKNLKREYRGFFTIRPTISKPIGRSIIDPNIVLPSNDFLICTSKYSCTANGVKFYVRGFPYASQDSETLTCAETTLWAIMEYFSNKYSEYSQLLPSTIIDTLERRTPERQLPSRGLPTREISFALKSFNFGTRIYSRESFDEDFENLLSCYIESGIPVIVAMDNAIDEEIEEPEIDVAHALLCIGRESFDKKKVQDLTKNNGNYELNDIDRKFVFVDDNQSPYQLANLGTPGSYYKEDSWQKCRIKHFIVPLYSKIYLDAFEAREFIISTLEELSIKDRYLRFFLASSRSYKDYIAKNSTMENWLKESILKIAMPKFIWVAEIFSEDSLKDEMAVGLVIIDATEANNDNLKPLIFAFLEKNIFIKIGNVVEPYRTDETIKPFNVYNYNLRGF